MESKIYIAHCPLCGRLLLKCKQAEKVELQCGKCHEFIEITIKIHNGFVALHSNQKGKIAYA